MTNNFKFESKRISVDGETQLEKNINSMRAIRDMYLYDLGFELEDELETFTVNETTVNFYGYWLRHKYFTNYKVFITNCDNDQSDYYLKDIFFTKEGVLKYKSTYYTGIDNDTHIYMGALTTISLPEKSGCYPAGDYGRIVESFQITFVAPTGLFLAYFTYGVSDKTLIMSWSSTAIPTKLTHVLLFRTEDSQGKESFIYFSNNYYSYYIPLEDRVFYEQHNYRDFLSGDSLELGSGLFGGTYGKAGRLDCGAPVLNEHQNLDVLSPVVWARYTNRERVYFHFRYPITCSVSVKKGASGLSSLVSIASPGDVVCIDNKYYCYIADQNETPVNSLLIPFD